MKEWRDKNKMAQDIVADALNQIMNLKAVGKEEVRIKRSSKLLTSLLEMMKKKGHIDFTIEGDEKKPEIVVKIIKLNICRAIKPRYFVGVGDIEKYLRRFLPSRKFGVLVVSTNKGLKTHAEAEEQNLGGALMAYFY